MNIYKEFCALFSMELREITEISEENQKERFSRINEITAFYSKIIGFYNSNLFNEFRSNMDKSMITRVLENQKRLDKVLEYETEKQIPYIDEFISSFNLYYGLISGNLISLEANNNNQIDVGNNLHFKIKEE